MVATKTYSVIEIEPSFIEIKIYEKDEKNKKKYKELEQIKEDIDLFSDFQCKKEIPIESIRKICDILKKMEALIKDYGCNNKKLIFSSFYKGISNFPMLIDQIKLKTTLPIHDIDLDENNLISIKKLLHSEKDIFSKKEAKLFFSLYPFHSTTSLFYKGELSISEQINLGIEKLYLLATQNKITPKRTYDFIYDYIESYSYFLKKEVGRKIINKMIIDGELERKLVKNIFDRDNLKDITLNELKEKLRTLQKYSYDELATLYECSETFAKLKIITLSLLVSFSEYLNVKEIKFLDYNIKDILALEYFNPEIKSKFDDILWQITLDSVIRLGKRFSLDEDHSGFVNKLGLKIMDKLKDKHLLTEEYYKLFIICAYLHDIGKSINFKNHEEHSVYIFKNTKIFGLNENKVKQISFIIKGHTSNVDINELYTEQFKGEELIQLLKIIAIMKIATALDRGKKQKLYNPKINLNKNGLHIIMNSDNSFYMEKNNFEQQSKLFKYIFDLDVTLKVNMEG